MIGIKKIAKTKDSTTLHCCEKFHIFVSPSIKNILLIFILLLLFYTIIFTKNRLCNILIVNKHGKSILLMVEIADTLESMKRGLMFRKKLNINKGMLFVFKKEKKCNFWMKNTHIPLSIAYIDKHGVINEIYNMKPMDTSITYPSVIPAKYALETNRGWFKKHNITVGCRLILNGCFGK